MSPNAATAPEPVVTPEQVRRNRLVGGTLFLFVLVVIAGTIVVLAKTKYNPFEEEPHYIIRAQR